MKFDGPGNILLRNVGKPPFIYGTAWKKESTTSLVVAALAAGFTAVDTAAQPRHYREDLVGNALRSAYKFGITTRENLFVSDMRISVAHCFAPSRALNTSSLT
jgi:diketogulonate reductase-like aldo/keto reductase